MSILDSLIENYDFTEPIKDEDILFIWKEITSGVQVFEVGEKALDINAENYAKIFSVLSEGKKRDLFDDREVTKFEEFLISLKKLKEKTIDGIMPAPKKIKIEAQFFENSADEIFNESLTPKRANEEKCEICSAVFTKDSGGLKKHKEAFHSQIRFKCSECEQLFNVRFRCINHIKKRHNRKDIFPQKISLDPEINKLIQNDNPDKYKCESCPARFEKESKTANPIYWCIFLYSSTPTITDL
jgi:hypothetical protein